MESIQTHLPIAAMITVECCGVGLTTLAKAAFSAGLNHFVFVVYTNALAAILFFPLAFFIDRDKRPPLTWPMLARFFLLAFFGTDIAMESIQTHLPIAAMITVECCGVGLTTLAKAAFSAGLNHFVFVVYTNALAAILFFPLAFFIDRDKRPPLTWPMLARFFLLAFFGITVAHNCTTIGLQYSSVVLASTILNLVPAITFILGIIFRLEKVCIRSPSSYAKVLGTLISVSGAMVATLYKGPVVTKFWSTKQNLEETDNIVENTIPLKDWIMGSLLFSGSCVSLAIWTIMQVQTFNKYPAQLSIIAFMTVFGTIQSAAVTFLVEHNLSIWYLHWDVEVISILYTAIIGIGLTFTLQIWCIRKKGPLFVVMFKPISILISAMAGATFLGDRIHIGSMVGAILIISGLYAVIWGKSKESSHLDPLKCVAVDIKQPLLGCRAA